MVGKLGFDRCGKCIGLLQGHVVFLPTLFLFLFSSQPICEVMGIYKGKQIEEVFIFPDIISSKILGELNSSH
jgi:hypothetical protein